GLDPPMPELYADTLATLAAGRTAVVARLRTIATRLEETPARRRCRGAHAPRAGGGSVGAAGSARARTRNRRAALTLIRQSQVSARRPTPGVSRRLAPPARRAARLPTPVGRRRWPAR